MSMRRFSSPSRAAIPPMDGCPPGFLLPPLSVLVVGGLLAILLLGPAGVGMTGLAGSPDETVLAAGIPGDDLLFFVPSPLSPVFTPEVQHWGLSIRRWAEEAGLDPNLAATVMQIESCGDPEALSSAGAMGLFQVMPFHFVTTEDPFDPETNAFRGLDYLRRSMEAAGGDPRLAFAGYNGGIGVIPRSESTWAAETVRYAYWGSGIYAEASAGASHSDRLDEWLQAGGASLCRQAAGRLGIDP